MFQKSEVGGKGFHLQAMDLGGLPVPRFICVPWRRLQELFSSENPHFWADLEDEMANVFSSYQSNLEEICLRVQDKILQAHFATGPWNELLLEIDAQFGKDFLISVRSSAIDEDSQHTSFAGQHLTKLFVQRADIQATIKECVASAWSFGAISYRLLHQLPTSNIKFAVVLQRMVNAQKSGIGFSMDITRNLGDAIITAGYGLGEGVVADKVECDTYRVHRSSKFIERTIIEKKWGMRWNSQKQLTLEPVTESEQLQPCLTSQELEAVFQCLLRAEKLLGYPADVEFSIDASGELQVLQMRPITTLNIEEIEILDNTNIVESYPGITLPLSFSFAQQAYKKLFENSARYFWLGADWVQQHSQMFDHLIAHPYGRVYYRLDNWYRMTTLVYNSPKAIQAWEKAVGLSQPLQSKFSPSLGLKLRILAAVAAMVLRFRAGNKRFFTSFSLHYQRFIDFRNQTNSPQELWVYFQARMTETFRDWPLTVVNDFIAFKVFGWLQTLIARWKISPNEEFANELISGYGAVDSELAVVHLLELKSMVLSDENLTKILQGPSDSLIDFIRQHPSHPFSVAWNCYLRRFGDRTFAELKLETITPRMNPALLADLLKTQLSSTLTADNFKENSQRVRLHAWQTVQQKLSPWNPKYWIFRWVANLAAFGVMSRENMRYCRTRMYGASRDIFLKIGAWMHEDGFIQNPRDVFYLSMSELEDYCLHGNDSNPQGLKFQQLVDQHKSEFAYAETIDLPDRIVYQGGELPVFQPMEAASGFASEEVQRWQGVAVSKGIVEAEAVVMVEPNLTADVRGKILVSKMTDPGWVFLMSQASALVTEKGSLLSHTAIVGRELGIPVVVGIGGITSSIKTGDRLRVNGAMGVVERC